MFLSLSFSLPSPLSKIKNKNKIKHVNDLNPVKIASEAMQLPLC